MQDNPHATFFAHDCIPSKTKVELLTVRKNVNVEISALQVDLQRGLMGCLFAASSWFVRRASLTVNVNLSDVTNRYYTVLYRTVAKFRFGLWEEESIMVFSGSRKIQTLGSTVQWETWQASFPTGTAGPWVGIFLSPLDTNDGFYLSPKYRAKWKYYIVQILQRLFWIQMSILLGFM